MEFEAWEGYILTLMPPELYDDVLFDAILTLIDPGVESMAIANTGFIGLEPEILIPQSILESMVSGSVTLDVVERV